MNIEQTKTVTIDCADCGTEEQLIINDEKQGFFETGWRADYSHRNQPAFVCGICVTNCNGKTLQEQKKYLEHIFEAQTRFSE